ncbi:DUF4197 domain-containing protein [Solimonas soli]|uniref:DUF4197 domain-containing protein n=1 Tax=Solimonas soli TaxID=413479 RepID=UPI0004B5E300
MCVACAGGAWPLAAPSSPAGAAAGLDDSQIVAGLREALAQGVTRAVNELGRPDGFWKDPDVRIPLPDPLAGAEKTLRQFGQGNKLDNFQLALNRAAESAVPQVAIVLGDAVRQMSIKDARAILAGPPDAATQYFRRVSGATLRERMLPIVQGATAGVGVAQSYKKLAGQIGSWLQPAGKSIPDLDGYVTDQALDALFAKIAIEEANIRQNPAARGSELLRKVFAAP